MSFLKTTTFDMEQRIYAEPDSFLKEIAQQLLMEVNRLKHELDDPNYNYSGRINRAAILYRNAAIEKLTNEIKELKKPVPQELLAEIDKIIEKAKLKSEIKELVEDATDYYKHTLKLFIKQFDALMNSRKEKVFGLSCSCKELFNQLLEARGKFT